MKYLNQFHKESQERCMKKIQAQKNSPLNAKEESKKHFEMHKKLKELYPKEAPKP